LLFERSRGSLNRSKIPYNLFTERANFNPNDFLYCPHTLALCDALQHGPQVCPDLLVEVVKELGLLERVHERRVVQMARRLGRELHHNLPVGADVHAVSIVRVRNLHRARGRAVVGVTSRSKWRTVFYKKVNICIRYQNSYQSV
jgi:hypothetical protein